MQISINQTLIQKRDEISTVDSFYDMRRNAQRRQALAFLPKVDQNISVRIPKFWVFPKLVPLCDRPSSSTPTSDLRWWCRRYLWNRRQFAGWWWSNGR